MMPIVLKLSLDAHYPVPSIGKFMLYKGIVYKIISSHYVPETNEDEEEIYGYQDEHLIVEVQDATYTEEGQILIADEAIKQDKLRTARYLKMRVKSEGTPIERVDGELVTPPERNVLFDSFNVYGSGERLIQTETGYWYLINNGGDGGDWGRNTVRTSGAGAYGWVLSLSKLVGGAEEC